MKILNVFVALNYFTINNISRGSLTVRCQAHNLKTENACVGSIPTPATNILYD